MVDPLCLICCIWKERNAWSFEDNRDFGGRAEKDYVQCFIHMNKNTFFF
jgi:hypothetical protein